MSFLEIKLPWNGYFASGEYVLLLRFLTLYFKFYKEFFLWMRPAQGGSESG